MGRASHESLVLNHMFLEGPLTRSEIGVDGWQLTAVRIAATAALAVPSYYLVELPIRRGWAIPRTWMRPLAPAAPSRGPQPLAAPAPRSSERPRPRSRCRDAR